MCTFTYPGIGHSKAFQHMEAPLLSNEIDRYLFSTLTGTTSRQFRSLLIISIVLPVRFSMIPESRRDSTYTKTCALIRSGFLWYTGWISMNDFIVLNERSICHCTLYAEITSLSGRSGLVTMRNLPATFFSTSFLFSFDDVPFTENFANYFSFPSNFFRSF